MDLVFENARLCRTCNRRAAMVKTWGEESAAAVAQHLQELEAVANLADMSQLPHVRVTHDGVDGRASVVATTGVRIGVRWDADDPSEEPEDSWPDVTGIVIATIVVDEGGADG
jgi:hypothetical protein